MNIYKSKTSEAGRQTMQTPPGIAEYCASVWGCDVDLAASATNKKFHLYYSDVSTDGLDGYRGDALTDRWSSVMGVGFCNPPYADLRPWLNKAGIEAKTFGFTSIFLIPTFNGEEWGDLVWFAREIIFIKGRINFIVEATGKPLSGNGRGSMLAVFGPGHFWQPNFSQICRDLLVP